MVDGLESPLEIEWAWLSVGSDTSPVVEPVGQVAGLLDLGQHDPFADGVDGAGGHDDALAGSGLEAGHARIDVAGVEGGCQLLGSGSRAEPDPQSAARPAGEDVPGFGLAPLSLVVSRGDFIVGVNLQREPVGGVEELDQQRERIARSMSAQQLAATFGDQLLQCPTVKGATVDNTLVVFQVDDFPALGQGRFNGQIRTTARQAFDAVIADDLNTCLGCCACIGVCIINMVGSSSH
mgnify:CR=1 FL=1